jgi:hypothetical protein
LVTVFTAAAIMAGIAAVASLLRGGGSRTETAELSSVGKGN